MHIERHNFATFLWTWFLRKFFSEVSSKIFRILIIRDSFFESVLSISNVKIATAFARYLVNDKKSSTFTSVCTSTFYFGICVTVAFSIEKVFICKVASDFTYQISL